MSPPPLLDAPVAPDALPIPSARGAGASADAATGAAIEGRGEFATLLASIPLAGADPLVLPPLILGDPGNVSPTVAPSLVPTLALSPSSSLRGRARTGVADANVVDPNAAGTATDADGVKASGEEEGTARSAAPTILSDPLAPALLTSNVLTGAPVAPALIPAQALPTQAVAAQAASARTASARTASVRSEAAPLAALSGDRALIRGRPERGDGVAAAEDRSKAGSLADAATESPGFAGIVAIAGGETPTGQDRREERGDAREHSTETSLDGGLVADRPADLAPTGAASNGVGRGETRPVLGASERARVVHQIVAKVAAHIEGLAVARSREPLTIRLEPADLGRIVVTVARDAAGLSAEMRASDPRVAEALDRHRSELTGALAAKVHLEARVTVGPMTEAATPRFDFSGGGSNPHPQNPAPASPRLLRDDATPTVPARRSRRLAANGLDLEI